MPLQTPPLTRREWLGVWLAVSIGAAAGLAELLCHAVMDLGEGESLVVRWWTR